MAVNVGTVVLDVKSDTTKLVSGMTKAQRVTQNAVKSMKRTIATLATAFAGGKIISNLSRTVDEIDKLAKTSAKLGVATDKLQALQYQAGQAGVSFNNFNMAAQRLTRRVAEAAQGTGEAVKALKELGIDAKELNNLDLDDKIRVLSEAFKKVGNQADKVRLAFKLFDSGGVDLLNMLEGGAEAVDRFYIKLAEMGVQIDNNFSKKMSNMKDGLQNVGKQFDILGIKTLQYSEKYVQRFIKMYSNIPKSIKSMWIVISSFFENGFKHIKLYGELIYLNLVATFNRTKKAISFIFSTLWNTVISGFLNVIHIVNQSINSLDTGGYVKFYNITNALGATSEFLSKGLINVKENVNETDEDFKNLVEEIKEVKKQLETVNFDSIVVKNSREQVKEQAKLVKTIKEKLSLSRKLKSANLGVSFGELEGINNLNNSLEQTNGLMSVLGNSSSSTIGGIKSAVDKLVPSFTKFHEAVEGIGTSLESNLMSAFDNIMEGAFSFKDTMKSILKDIVSQLIRTYVVQQAVQGITGAISGSFGGSVGAGSSLGGVSFFAKGGVVDTPHMFPMNGGNTGVMGEAGPEAIVPLKRSSDGSLGVGASPVNVSIINNSNNSEVRQEQSGNDLRVFIENVENTIASGINRGTSPVGEAVQGMKKQGRL